jgi:hypothetical protein
MCKNVDDLELAWHSIQEAVVEQVGHLWLT